MHDIPQIKAITEWSDLSPSSFHHEVVPLNQPAVLRGVVAHWPIVESAENSDFTALEYLRKLDKGKPLYTVVGAPEIDGRFFYREDLQGINFQRTGASISAAIEQLLALKDKPNAHSIAVQAGLVDDALPGFTDANSMPLLSADQRATLWMGNQSIVAPHYDIHDNIACVAVGRRRFTLFPPEQISNLYVGPTLDAPGGVPISMVDIRQPDLDKYPRFKEAAAHAQQAELLPGDAIYIPSPWWHAVESLSNFNLLINYWWAGLAPSGISPNNSLMHSMLTIADLGPAQRAAWRSFFDYYVFKISGDPAEHLPDSVHDIVTKMTPQQKKAVYTLLRDALVDET